MKVYTIGARVTQPTYGAGTITVANEHHTVVEFDEHGSRTFITGMVQLQPSDSVAPERPKRARRRRTES